MTCQKFETGYNNVQLKVRINMKRRSWKKVSILTLKHYVHAIIEQQVLLSAFWELGKKGDIVGYHLSYCY